MEHTDELAAKEGEIALRLRDLLAKTNEVAVDVTQLLADVQQLQGDVDDFSFQVLSAFQQLSEDEDYEHENLKSLLVQAGAFVKQANHLRQHVLRRQRSIEAGERSPPSASALPQRHRQAQTQAGVQTGQKPVNRLDSLKASRDMLELELLRMNAAHDLLAKDATLLAATQAGHSQYGGTIEDASALAKLYAQREARDRLHIRLAFLLFLLVAAYIMGRRVAWTLAGVHVPGIMDGLRLLLAWGMARLT